MSVKSVNGKRESNEDPSVNALGPPSKAAVVAEEIFKKCPPGPPKKGNARSRYGMEQKTIGIPGKITPGTTLEIRSWKDPSKTISLMAVHRLGSGDHGEAWLVSTVDGFKIYKVDKNPNASYRKEELLQYAQLRDKNVNFPVAIHEDLEFFIQTEEFQNIYAMEDEGARNTALLEFAQRHLFYGYHLREYIPIPFPEQLDLSSPMYAELKDMFRVAYEHGIAVDLQRNNIGYFADTGRVVYFDLMPHDERINQQHNPFEGIVDQCLRTFGRPDSDVYKMLDPRPAK